MAENQKEYVLGTGNEELSRLADQHRVWADAAVGAWKRAGFGPGSRLLDVGCGPGFATFDLAQLVTQAGSVVGVDESKGFLDYLADQATKRNLPQVKVARGDVLDLEALGEKPFDGIYIRWVLCWLKDPQKAVEGMRRVLKPGGRLVIHDYFNWKAMGLAPRSAAVEALVAAAIRSFEERQGNVDVAGSLLGMLRKSGFEVKHFDVHQRAPRGGGMDATAAWIIEWWRIYGAKLLEQKRVTAQVFESAQRDLDKLEKDPDLFFFCPPLFEFVAVRT